MLNITNSSIHSFIHTINLNLISLVIYLNHLNNQLIKHNVTTTPRDMDQQTKKKNRSKSAESSLGMHVSLMTSLIATMLPIPSIATTSTLWVS